MKRICIIGLGWLGKQLASYLTQEGHFVSGTTTDENKMSSLSSNRLKVYLARIQNLQDWDTEIFAKYEYYIVTIPPISQLDYSSRVFDFVQKLLSQNPTAKIVYTSSTSVYGNQPNAVDELSQLKPTRDSAKQIARLESLLLDKYPDQLLILRLGGLCGYKRHPVFHLAGSKSVKKPNAVVNLIHAEDICRFIAYTLVRDRVIGVFNLCSTQHPTRRSYYQWAAKKVKLPIPLFDENDNFKDKTIICNGVLNLDFELKYPSPYDYPELR